jgi:hypothetical protein
VNLSAGGRQTQVSPSQEIDYLASHFYELDVNAVKDLSHDFLGNVLGCAQLVFGPKILFWS